MPAWVICSEAAAVTWGNYRQASVKPPFKSRRVEFSWQCILFCCQATATTCIYWGQKPATCSCLALLETAEHYKSNREKHLGLKNGGICRKPLLQYLTFKIRAAIPGRWKGWWGLLEIWQTYRVVFTCRHVSRLRCNLLIQLTLS